VGYEVLFLQNKGIPPAAAAASKPNHKCTNKKQSKKTKSQIYKQKTKQSKPRQANTT